jgi:hypothetical protein
MTCVGLNPQSSYALSYEAEMENIFLSDLEKHFRKKLKCGGGVGRGQSYL